MYMTKNFILQRTYKEFEVSKGEGVVEGKRGRVAGKGKERRDPKRGR